jgi:Helix-turn-helix domain
MNDAPNDPTPLAVSLAVSLAQRFQARRRDCAFSVATLARLAAVEPDLIRAIEEARPVLDPRAIEAVGAVLGLSPRELSTHEARGPDEPEA